MKNDSLKLDMFFPDELLSTTSVNHDDSSIHIKMRSKTHSSKCPECGKETQIYHGTVSVSIFKSTFSKLSKP